MFLSRGVVPENVPAAEYQGSRIEEAEGARSPPSVIRRPMTVVNALLCELYGLTEEEIMIIEGERRSQAVQSA